MGCREMLKSPSLPVVLALFLHCLSLLGTIKPVGIFYDDMSISLQMTSTDLGVALGLFSAFTYFPAPLVAVMFRWCSRPRLVLVVGALLASLGVIACAFITSAAQLSFCLATAGLGHCVFAICCVIVLDTTAKENFNLLYSIGTSGTGFGMTIAPPIAGLLVNLYGWRGGMLILGGLMANIVPCTLAIQVPRETEELEEQRSGQSNPCRQETDFRSQETPLTEFETEGMGLEANNGDGVFDHEGGTACDSKEETTPFLGRPQDKDEAEAPEDTARQYVIRNESNTEESEGANSDTTSAKLIRLIRESDFYKDPLLNLIVVSCFVLGIVYSGWHAFLVLHALQRGISIEKTAVITLCAGIGSLTGRLLTGVLTHRLLHPLTLCLVLTFVFCASVLWDVFLPNFYVMLVTSFLSACTLPAMAILHQLAGRQRASPGKFPTILGVVEVVFGSGAFLGGYLSGMIADRFSSFDATFKLLAFIGIFDFFLLLPPRLVDKINNRTASDSNG